MSFGHYDGLPDGYWEDMAKMSGQRLAEELANPSCIHFTLARLNTPDLTIKAFLKHFDTDEARQCRLAAIYSVAELGKQRFDAVFQYAKAKGAHDELLKSPDIPPSERNRLEKNLAMMAKSLGDIFAEILNSKDGPSTLENMAQRLRHGPERNPIPASHRGIIWKAFCRLFVTQHRLPTRRELHAEARKSVEFSNGSSADRKFAEYLKELGLAGI